MEQKLPVIEKSVREQLELFEYNNESRISLSKFTSVRLIRHILQELPEMSKKLNYDSLIDEIDLSKTEASKIVI